MKHPNNVLDLEPKELAKKFMGTEYIYHLSFFKEMVVFYKKEGEADKRRGYIKLSTLLFSISIILFSVSKIFEEVWQICKPHMNKNDNHSS
jgi:isoprenylcysteine carboxyl methyltransferase (ICMT) family protein YpbQ